MNSLQISGSFHHSWPDQSKGQFSNAQKSFGSRRAVMEVVSHDVSDAAQPKRAASKIQKHGSRSIASEESA